MASWTINGSLVPPFTFVTAPLGTPGIRRRASASVRRHTSARRDLLRIAEPVLPQRGGGRDQHEMGVSRRKQATDGR